MTLVTVALVIAGLKAGVPSLPPTSYEFVLRVNRLVEFNRPDYSTLVGRLDAGGEFTLSHTLPGVPPELLGKDFALYRSRRDSPSLVRLGVNELNPQPVYELRSGALIPGTMVFSGPFVPTVGGAIIRFADHKYSPTAPKIWNLPGYFRAVIPGQPPVGPEEPIRIPNPSWLSNSSTVLPTPKR